LSFPSSLKYSGEGGAGGLGEIGGTQQSTPPAANASPAVKAAHRRDSSKSFR